MAGTDDILTGIRNVVTNLGGLVQSWQNAYPVATNTTSPAITAVNNLGTTAGTTIIGASATRHGIIFHNPGTATAYVYPSALTTANTTTLGGVLSLAAGSTISWPAPMYANINSAFSAFVGTGNNQPLTVVEFF